jgi:serine/threonine protein kinase
VRAALTRLAEQLNAAMATVRGPPPADPLVSGGQLGTYSLISPLAVGNTTEVWRAKIKGEQGFEKEIALKALLPDAARVADTVRAFTGEATIAARLYHPNIVQLVDSGQAGDRYYIAMELVRGLTLQQMLVRLRALVLPFPVRLLVQVALQSCEALNYVHERVDEGLWVGVLHRDLTPDNLMLTSLGVVKVIDFGSARLASDPPAPWSMSGQTPYMAPERIHGLREDRRSEIYSLGVILYELATGQRPYDGEDISAIARIVEGRPIDPRDLVADLPADLTRIILKAMAREPADRYATAELMGNDLQRLVHQEYARTRREDKQSVDLTLQLIFNQHGRELLVPRTHGSKDEITRPLSIPFDSIAVDSIPVDSIPVEAPVSGLAPDDPTAVGGPVPPDALSPVGAPDRVATPPEAELAVVVAELHLSAAPTTPWLFEQQSAQAALAIIASSSETQELPPVPLWHAPGEGTAPEATRCFDRGLAFLHDKDYRLALPQWERACQLDPDNRVYQSNLRRLRAQMHERIAGPPRADE